MNNCEIAEVQNIGPLTRPLGSYSERLWRPTFLLTNALNIHPKNNVAALIGNVSVRREDRQNEAEPSALTKLTTLARLCSVSPAVWYLLAPCL